MEEIRLTTWDVKNHLKWINHQPQLVNAGFLPWTVRITNLTKKQRNKIKIKKKNKLQVREKKTLANQLPDLHFWNHFVFTTIRNHWVPTPTPVLAISEAPVAELRYLRFGPSANYDPTGYRLTDFFDQPVRMITFQWKPGDQRMSWDSTLGDTHVTSNTPQAGPLCLYA